MLESTLHLYCCCYCVEARVVEAAGAQLARHNAESEQAVRYGEAWRNSVEAAHADLAEEIVAVKAEAACGARALRTALGVQARTTAAELKVMQGRFAVRSKGCPSCLVCGRGTERGPAEPLSPAVQSAGGAPWVGVALHARLSPLASRTAFGHGHDSPDLVVLPRAQSAGVSRRHRVTHAPGPMPARPESLAPSKARAVEGW